MATCMLFLTRFGSWSSVTRSLLLIVQEVVVVSDCSSSIAGPEALARRDTSRWRMLRCRLFLSISSRLSRPLWCKKMACHCKKCPHLTRGSPQHIDCGCLCCFCICSDMLRSVSFANFVRTCPQRAHSCNILRSLLGHVSVREFRQAVLFATLRANVPALVNRRRSHQRRISRAHAQQTSC